MCALAGSDPPFFLFSASTWSSFDSLSEFEASMQSKNENSNAMSSPQPRELAILQCKVNCGQRKPGTADAPEALCTPQFLSTLNAAGWNCEVKTVEQAIDSPTTTAGSPTKVRRADVVLKTNQAIAQAAGEEFEQGKFVLCLGGDHSIAMGSISSSAKKHPDLRVVWFDAHADINTAETTESGNMHGMPVAALLGLKGMNVIGGEWANYPFACLSPSQVAYVGLRDVEDGEMEILKALSIKSVFMDELHKYGMKNVVESILQWVAADGMAHPIHLSFDVDGLDPDDVRSTGTMVPGGVRLDEALLLIDALRETGWLVSADIVEVNPQLGNIDEVAQTIENSHLVVHRALGATSSA